MMNEDPQRGGRRGGICGVGGGNGRVVLVVV